MWEGITVLQNSNLNFQGGRIEDAIAAVDARNNSTQTINSVIFRRNVTGYFVGANGSNQTINLNGFQGNVFQGGNLNVGGDSFVGMWINNVSLLNTGTGGGATNLFRDLGDGIISVNSRLNVRDCSFSGINENGDQNGFNLGVAVQSHGPNGNLNIDGSNVPVFAQDCSTGVFSTETNLAISNSIMQGVLRGVQVTDSPNRTVVVTNNTINLLLPTASFGIFINDSDPGLFGIISNNRVNGNSFFLTPIGVLGNNLSGLVIIELNQINGAVVGAGIDCHDFSGIFMSTNTINISDFTTSGMIHVINNESNGNIEFNTLTGGTIRGMFIQNSPNLNYQCNQTDLSRTGIEFDGGCNNSDFKTSFMTNHNVGLSLTGNNTVLGIQEWKGNSWINGGSYSPAAQHLGQNVFQSRFLVNDKDECNSLITYVPDPVSPNFGFFDVDNSSPNLKACCGLGSPPPAANAVSNLDAIDEQIADGTYSDFMTEDVATWNAEKYLFKRLKENLELVEPESIFDQFLIENEDDWVGKFYNLKSEIEQVLSYSEEQKNAIAEIESQVESKINDIELLNSSILDAIENSNSIDDYLVSKNVLLTELSDFDSLQAIIIQDHISKKQLGIQSLLEKIEQMLPPRDYQVYELDMWRTYLNYLQNDRTLSAEQNEMIEFLSSLCPRKYGIGVYMARSYLPHEQQHNFDDDALCSEPSFRSISKEKNNAELVSLFPNPVSNELVVEIPIKLSDSGQINILNSIGLKENIVVIENGKNRYKINTSSLPKGIYFVQFESKSEINKVALSKFIKI